MRTLLRLAGWGLVTLVVLAFAASFHPEVRNVARAIRPSRDYDSAPPAVPEHLPRPAILVFSKTNGFRHAEAIEAGKQFFEELASRRGWGLFMTENGAVCQPDLLSMFAVVVWLNASGAPLNQDQRAALRAWIEGGGGFLGLHSATDNSHAGWPWYQLALVGAKFTNHTMGPQLQEALAKREASDAGLPEQWRHTEEWYSFDRSVRGQPGVKVLATVDESTYSPRFRMLWMDQDLAMGDHPIVWTRQTGAGRAFFSVLGHSGETYRLDWHRQMLERAVEWAGGLGRIPIRQAPNPLPSSPG